LVGGGYFGVSLATVGDLNGDGVTDIAVGAAYDGAGALWVLFLQRDGSVVQFADKIGSGLGGIPSGVLDPSDLFGSSVALVGDVTSMPDPDPDPDRPLMVAVGAYSDDDGGPDRGAVYILFVHRDGSVVGYQKISSTSGGFDGALANEDAFGYAVTAVGDLNGDGVPGLSVSRRVFPFAELISQPIVFFFFSFFSFFLFFFFFLLFLFLFLFLFFFFFFSFSFLFF
jgi:hypothetical protein